MSATRTKQDPKSEGRPKQPGRSDRRTRARRRASTIARVLVSVLTVTTMVIKAAEHFSRGDATTSDAPAAGVRPTPQAAAPSALVCREAIVVERCPPICAAR